MNKCQYRSSPFGHPIILDISVPTVYVPMPPEFSGFLVFGDVDDMACALY